MSPNATPRAGCTTWAPPVEGTPTRPGWSLAARRAGLPWIGALSSDAVDLRRRAAWLGEDERGRAGPPRKDPWDIAVSRLRINPARSVPRSRPTIGDLVRIFTDDAVADPGRMASAWPEAPVRRWRHWAAEVHAVDHASPEVDVTDQGEERQLWLPSASTVLKSSPPFNGRGMWTLLGWHRSTKERIVDAEALEGGLELEAVGEAVVADRCRRDGSSRRCTGAVVGERSAGSPGGRGCAATVGDDAYQIAL